MHEFSIMESALNLASEKARQAGATRVHTLKLRVGSLSGTVSEALHMAFEALSLGTVFEGAVLDIDEVPARFYCAHCGNEFTAERLYAECPICQQASSDLRSGRELELASMEVE
jgi:hydrogenase nickel incorporation protein HypA/HybF